MHNKSKSLLATFVITLLFSFNTKADSPLTSTYFWKAYSNIEIVKQASEMKGTINKSVIKFISDENQAIDLKLAAINALGWQYHTRNNYTEVIKYLKLYGGYKTEEEIINNGSGDLLICLAYLKAMGNYFDVEEARYIANLAIQKSPLSYSVNIVHALIKAQYLMDHSWGEVYNSTNAVRLNYLLDLDMNSKARELIFEYMDIYEKYSKL